MISRRGLLAFIGLGAVAQLAEHLPRKQTVFGSIPNGTSIGKGVLIDPETLANEFDLPDWGGAKGQKCKEIYRQIADKLHKQREVMDAFDEELRQCSQRARRRLDEERERRGIA